MSRIYHNEPLQSITVATHYWQSEWRPQQLQQGDGVLLEGTIDARSRHVIIDNKQSKARYYVLHFRIQKAHKRQYEPAGREIEPNFSETAKVRTGYLHSSYKTTAKGESDLLTPSQVETLLINPDMHKVTSNCNKAGTLPMWLEEAQTASLELNTGDSLRVKTKGNSLFIESLTKLDVQSTPVCNYAGGEQVGASWTDKVMTVKGQGADRTLPQDQVEGVDEDEWDD